MKVYTCGHSNADLVAFVGLLAKHGVEVVADVRSNPRSRLPHFDLVPLQEAIEAAGMSYRFMGDRLGGVPRDPRIAARWRQGRLDPIIVDHLRSTEEWSDGIAELAHVARRGAAVCVICSEADPSECHRKAVALDLAEALGGAEIVHLAISKAAPGEVGVQEVLL